jgi:hypothetical protein
MSAVSATRAVVTVGTCLAVLLAACGGGAESDAPVATADVREPSLPAPDTPDHAPTPGPVDEEPVAPPQPAPTEAPTPSASPAPEWLGTRVLTPGPTGYPPPQETPPELVDRRITTVDLLPPPPDESFSSTIAPVPAEVVSRSTWSALCPVTLEDLRYVLVTFWGFDGRVHTGELLLNAAVAEDVATVFARLHDARFPIEEMRITRTDELDAPPTGDGNNTGAFVCRPTRGSSSWSEHARGLAVDINPFHNPLAREGVVLPELATAYVDRSWHRPGMIQPGDEVTEAFAAIGWHWGGNWRSLSDWMHFSHNGR